MGFYEDRRDLLKGTEYISIKKIHKEFGDNVNDIYKNIVNM